MKQIVKMSRLAGMLEKAFNMLNVDFFEGKLETPVVSVIPTPRAYAHYSVGEIWNTATGKKHEINIASGTLNRSLEEIIGSLVHEMVHEYDDTVLNVQDCSRAGQYHNRTFAIEAEKHGLNVERCEKYGWAITSPDDTLLGWVIEHYDELREIEMCRADCDTSGNGGGRSTIGGTPDTTNPNSHSRKYICPKCGTSVRATKVVRIICADCLELMQEM